MPNHEGSATQDGNVYECWSMIAAIAAVTERIRVGSLVSPTTFRHPTVLANTAATIDQISRGRLTLGIGAGWQVNEHLAYGVDLLEGKDRVDRFVEAIQIIKSMLTHNRTSFAGQHFSITDAPDRYKHHCRSWSALADPECQRSLRGSLMNGTHGGMCLLLQNGLQLSLKRVKR